MPVTITLSGESAEDVREQMRTLLGGVAMPVVSPVSTDSERLPQTTEASPTVAKRGRKPKDNPPAPAPVEPSPVQPSTDGAAAEQDAADEKADTAAQKGEDKELTLDDVRDAAQPYVKKHGIEAAQADLQDCLEAAVGVRQISKLDPKNQSQISKAVEAFNAAAAGATRYVKPAPALA